MIPISFFFGGARRTDQTAGRKEGIIGAMTVAWDDQFKRQNIMWKVPRNIRMNDNIVVREDEIAVFYRDGKVLAYLDRPDRYALTSQNVAILGKLIQALCGGRGPHQERTDETTERHARQDESERPEGRRLRGEPQ